MTNRNAQGTPGRLLCLISLHSTQSVRNRLRSPSIHIPSIHILDDDSLLRIFSLCRPDLIDEGEDDMLLVLMGGKWVRERWWYKLIHVCRRWRYLVLESASHLGLCLVCTYGTPVADMLARSPPLPLVIDYVDLPRKITAKDEKGIIAALHHPDRVLRIRLRMPIQNLQKVLPAIDDEFPMLEYMHLMPHARYYTDLILPGTFQAPHLRDLRLRDIVLRCSRCHELGVSKF